MLEWATSRQACCHVRSPKERLMFRWIRRIQHPEASCTHQVLDRRPAYDYSVVCCCRINRRLDKKGTLDVAGQKKP